MRRLCALLGICFALALISSVLLRGPRSWHITPPAAQHRLLPAPTAMTGQQPIPAIASTPQLTVPRWFIYVGAVASFIVATLMLLCKCQTNLRCRHPRQVPLWRAQVLPARSMGGVAEVPDDRDRPYPPPSAPR